MTDSHLITSPAINRALLFQNRVTLPRETHNQKNEAVFANVIYRLFLMPSIR